MGRSLTASLALAVLVATGCNSPSERHFISSVTNKPARGFALKDLTGRLVKSDDFRGKPMLLAFWAYG